MLYKTSLLFLFVLASTILFAQHPLSQFNKSKHLSMLKDGVLLVRLSEQEKKVEALSKRGQIAMVQEIQAETKELNELIELSFAKHFDYCKVYFINPEDTKSILKNKSNTILDIVTNEKIDLSTVNNIYVTDYGYGHPAEGHERYNRKGFQLLHIEDGQLTDLGRDIFYVGVKKGLLAPKFSKSMQKSVIKLNDRLKTGRKYPST